MERQITHKILGVRMVSPKWVLKSLDNKSEAHQIDDIKGNFEPVCIGTWPYHYDPQTKPQLKECHHNSSLNPKKFWTQKSTGNILVSMF